MRLKMRLITFIYFIINLSAFEFAASQTITENKALGKIHDRIMDDYPALTHVSSDELMALTDTQDIIILDVREETEYTVSHIDGAVRVDPNISNDEFISRYGDDVRGKTVVLYCSVGRRSSKLGNRLSADLKASGAVNVSNLEGGIFYWHNQQLPLRRNETTTQKVHPYNRWWSRLIARKGEIAYAPE